MEKKYALVTGTTGGIGGALADLLLECGYEVLAPVRSVDKAKEYFGDKIGVHIEKVDLESQESVNEYLKSLLSRKMIPCLSMLTAGTFKWDSSYGFPSKEENEQKSIIELKKINCGTKETFVNGFRQIFPQEMLLTMDLLLVGSQAANFSESDFRRRNEEGYVQSMKAVKALGIWTESLGIFKSVSIDEPGLIDTPMARQEFNKDTIGEDPDWSKVVSPENNAAVVLAKIGYLQK